MKLLTCGYCRFYEAIDEERGHCFGVIVMANKSAEKCPTFQPKFMEFLLGNESDTTPL